MPCVVATAKHLESRLARPHAGAEAVDRWLGFSGVFLIPRGSSMY